MYPESSDVDGSVQTPAASDGDAGESTNTDLLDTEPVASQNDIYQELRKAPRIGGDN